MDSAALGGHELLSTQKTENHILQYKVVFYLSWILLYLFFPSWISLHSIFEAKGIPGLSYPFARVLVIMAFTIYFSVSAYLMNSIFNALVVDKPVVVKLHGWRTHIKNNVWLVIACGIALVLHVHAISLPMVITGETVHLQNSLLIYSFLNTQWHRLINVPIQCVFWSLVVLIFFIIRQLKAKGLKSSNMRDRFEAFQSNNSINLLFVLLVFGFFSIYSYFFPYYSFQESMHLLRYPPVSRYINLIVYLAFGYSQTASRIVQLIFYILSAIYIYRSIDLFRKKEAALLGATIYLFLPLIFSYASRAALASGTIFFICLISFHFLKFIKDQDSRDLILSSFFIGIGFMYKRVVFLMFAICFIYLLLNRLKKRDLRPVIHFKVLLLSLVVILPWLKIGSLNMYVGGKAYLFSIDSLTGILSMLPGQLSPIILSLFVLSVVTFIFSKKDGLSLFFAFLFVAYYSFFTFKDRGNSIYRYTMTLYPSIAFFLAQFLIGVARMVRWRHAFKLLYPILTAYLIVVCLVPRSSSNITTFRYDDFESQYYPIDKATDWIKNRTDKDEKILVLFMRNYEFYVENIYEGKNAIDKDRFLYLSVDTANKLIYPLQNLKNFCHEEKISYVIFPFSPRGSFPPAREDKDTIQYLIKNKDNIFTEVAKLSHEDNYIIIYKLKENP